MQFAQKKKSNQVFCRPRIFPLFIYNLQECQEKLEEQIKALQMKLEEQRWSNIKYLMVDFDMLPIQHFVPHPYLFRICYQFKHFVPNITLLRICLMSV